jgi:hypothetical protein
MARYLAKEVELSKVLTTSSTLELLVHKNILIEKEYQHTISSTGTKSVLLIITLCRQVLALVARITGKEALALESVDPQLVLILLEQEMMVCLNISQEVYSSRTHSLPG